MKLYRTICAEEFCELFLIGKVTNMNKLQKSTACFRNINNEYISAIDKPFYSICCFNDDIYWFNDKNLILLELDIPEEKILYKGSGFYSFLKYNPFIFSKNTKTKNCYLRKILREYTIIPETYISDYSKNNVINVFFMNGCNIFHSLGDRKYNNISYETYFNYYIKNILVLMSKTIIKNDIVLLKKMNYLLLYNTSLNKFKNFLLKNFSDNKDFINKFHYYNKNDNLESIICKRNKYETFIKDRDFVVF